MITRFHEVGEVYIKLFVDLLYTSSNENYTPKAAAAVYKYSTAIKSRLERRGAVR